MAIDYDEFEKTMQHQFRVYYSQTGNASITLDDLYDKIETVELSFRLDKVLQEIGDNDTPLISNEGMEFNKMSEEAKLNAREKCKSLDHGKPLTITERGMFVKAYLNEMKDLIEMHNLTYGVRPNQKL